MTKLILTEDKTQTKPQSQLTKETVEALYSEFVKDTTHIEAVKAQQVEWMEPGFILELLVIDLEPYATIKPSDDFYIRYTGIAKILSASPYNEGPRSDIKTGDIVLTTDAMSTIRPNFNWTEWNEFSKSPQYKGVEPVKFHRWVHNWTQRGAWFAPDRAELVLNPAMFNMNEAAINSFRGPYVYKVDSHEVAFRIKNPFA